MKQFASNIDFDIYFSTNVKIFIRPSTFEFNIHTWGGFRLPRK